MPDSATRLASLLAQEDWLLEEIVGVIELDQVLTGTLLSRANSAASGSRHAISSVQAAVTREGPGVVLSLAIASVVRQEMQLPIPTYGLDEGGLWRHSVASALAVEQSRRFCRTAPSPLSYAAALLHDVGKLVLGRHLQSDVFSMLQRSYKEGGEAPLEAESENQGIHHGRLGGLIAHNWKLPTGIQAGITYHHNPDEVPDEEGRMVARLVALADVVAHRIGEGCGNDEPRLSKETVQGLGINRQGFEALSEATAEQLEKTLELYS